MPLIWIDNIFDPEREPELRNESGVREQALADLEYLFREDHSKWARASLMVAVALTRDGEFGSLAEELVSRVKAEVGLRFDVLLAQASVASATGRTAQNMTEELRLSVRTVGDLVSYLAMRRIALGEPPRSAFAMARTDARTVDRLQFPNLVG
jgi:hypothetical protein